jgi:hypothetical protein
LVSDLRYEWQPKRLTFQGHEIETNTQHLSSQLQSLANAVNIFQMSSRPPSKLSGKLYDADIRRALLQRLVVRDPSVSILHELPLDRGQRRADIVCVNGHLAGFEIKSDRDSLARLPGQVASYDAVFDYNTIVLSGRLLSASMQKVPDWWGVMLFKGNAESLKLTSVRRARRNCNQDKWALTRLLWKNECGEALRIAGICITRDQPVVEYWKLLMDMPLGFIRASVRRAFKLRRVPVSACLQTQDDDSNSISPNRLGLPTQCSEAFC